MSQRGKQTRCRCWRKPKPKTQAGQVSTDVNPAKSARNLSCGPSPAYSAAGPPLPGCQCQGTMMIYFDLHFSQATRSATCADQYRSSFGAQAAGFIARPRSGGRPNHAGLSIGFRCGMLTVGRSSARCHVFIARRGCASMGPSALFAHGPGRRLMPPSSALPLRHPSPGGLATAMGGSRRRLLIGGDCP